MLLNICDKIIPGATTKKAVQIATLRSSIHR